MADESDPEDKTEHISERRVKQAFDEGQVPLGRDAVMAASFAAGVIAMVNIAPRFRDAMVRFVEIVFTTLNTARYDTMVGHAAMVGGWGLAICGSVALAAIAASLAQTRGGFWAHLALPDFTRLGQSKITRIFTKEFLADFGMAIVKVVAVGGTAYQALRNDFNALPKLLTVSAETQMASSFEPLARAAVKVVTVMVLIAGADFALTYFRFREKMKMTRDEAKREHKEDEGDPIFKSRRRRKARELAKNRAVVEVPKADAIIVNPTHIAIAIRYRRDEGKAPRVTAKGKGQLAEIMRDLARENGIPIVQDITLARLLYKRVKVGNAVPAETYKAVAAILAFVYRVTGRSASTGASV